MGSSDPAAGGFVGRPIILPSDISILGKKRADGSFRESHRLRMNRPKNEPRDRLPEPAPLPSGQRQAGHRHQQKARRLRRCIDHDAQGDRILETLVGVSGPARRPDVTGVRHEIKGLAGRDVDEPALPVQPETATIAVVAAQGGDRISVPWTADILLVNRASSGVPFGDPLKPIAESNGAVGPPVLVMTKKLGIPSFEFVPTSQAFTLSATVPVAGAVHPT